MGKMTEACANTEALNLGQLGDTRNIHMNGIECPIALTQVTGLRVQTPTNVGKSASTTSTAMQDCRTPSGGFVANTAYEFEVDGNFKAYVSVNVEGLPLLNITEEVCPLACSGLDSCKGN